MKTIQCLLKEGKEKPLLGRHPWVFSGAIDRIEANFHAGDLVRVFSYDQKFLGIGYLNPSSQIAIRMLSFEDIPIDEAFFIRRIEAAVAMRHRFISGPTNTYRVIHSEGDYLSGLIADRYGDFLVVQFLTAGIEQWKDVIVDALQRSLPVKGIFEKDDSDLREMEGLKKNVALLWGAEPPESIEVIENGIVFLLDVREGQKTGFYLDQRDNRKLIGSHSREKSVLNCFAYTGGFSVYAACGGAKETVSVEASESALDLAKRNFEKNNIPFENHQFVKEDVFDYLRSCKRHFDLIILDPPAFCKNKQQILKAARGYKDINLNALKLLTPGGLLYTCSCSSFIEADLFQKIIFGAAKDAGKDLRILAKTSHAFDHPINIYHPEGEYLKGLLCEVQ